ncbi:type II toxin-antitoxin system HicB family antitoxin [Dethiosulfovibrio salsuginis]|uniref:Predicted nuclease of the RNAse H fold, HicB family n=1 Tax=Dethiosulfovibrio salsuginis TaxID=561720 RepID=A0A1X7JR03_9BACT|nr:type II toxin-antitoxin system HicB family antitoxin [Dethiosulfovibrio salsuginis]SMG30476.1 Predicted nuclease of the RNAse H fold, HicB family [Dethiosulfovibrio salsuginis]
MPPKHYRYPAIICPDDDGWTARFPDLENCFTCGDTVEEVILEAQAVLEECLYFREKDGYDIPTPTPIETISHPEGGFVQFIVADMPPELLFCSAYNHKKPGHLF